MHGDPPQFPTCVPAPWMSTCSVWLKVLMGSVASRPAYLMAGFVVLLDVL